MAWQFTHCDEAAQGQMEQCVGRDGGQDKARNLQKLEP